MWTHRREALRDAMRDCFARRGVYGGTPQVTACPTAKEGTGTESALTCKKVLFHPDLTIWHPVRYIVHLVPENRADRSWDPGAHAVRTVSTVPEPDQIDVRFISMRRVRAGRPEG